MEYFLKGKAWLRAGVMFSNSSWGQTVVVDWKTFFTTSLILSLKKSDEVLHLIQEKQNEAAVRTLAPWKQLKRKRFRIIEKSQCVMLDNMSCWIICLVTLKLLP